MLPEVRLNVAIDELEHTQLREVHRLEFPPVVYQVKVAKLGAILHEDIRPLVAQAHDDEEEACPVYRSPSFVG